MVPTAKNDIEHFELLPHEISTKFDKTNHQKTASIMQISKRDGKEKNEIDNGSSIETHKHISRMTSTKFNSSVYAYH